MAPAPGPASPLEPPSPSPSRFMHSIHAPASPPPTPSPAPPDYSSLIHSLQTRRPRQAAPSAVPPDLEADLKLAAQIGQSLLQEKTALQARLETSEKANGKLVDRLARAVKEKESLERRLEETVSSLEQSESSNRTLLSSLETERKTISRLSHDSGKLVATAKSLKALQQQHADSLQELESERRRADGAEAKARKMGERVRELEERLGKAIQDLEEMRQDKVLKESKRGENQTGLQEVKARHQARLASSSQATAHARAILGSGSPTPGGSHADNPEAKELLKMVETLVEENQLLRSESMELHGLLEKEREEIEASRSRLAEEAEIQEEDEELADDGRDLRGETDHFATHSRAASIASMSSFGDVQQPVRRGGPRRPGPISSQSTGLIGTNARMPVRRGHGRRAMSMDVTPQLCTVIPIGSAPNSPQPDRPHYSPFARPASIFSNDATDDPNADTASIASSSVPLSRSTRRQRPLSLSLGPSVFPLVPEDEDQTDRPISPFTRQAPFAHRRRSSQMSGGAVSLNGLGISSPLLDGSQFRSPRLSRGPAELVDATTQTTPPATPPRPRTPLPRTEVDIHSSSTAFSDPQAQLLRDISASPSSQHSSLHAPIPPATSEIRTAALGQLIDHVSKLLVRVQAADIATQEKRLRKQQLAGDVRFLAHANLKDLVNDIDSVRHHFRRVVEQERATQTRQTSLAASASATAASADTSLVTRRDFVSLVKLLRDLLFEASRLRMLVNRVQLEPGLAEKLKELDVPNAFEAVEPQGANGKGAAATATTAAGLLAPLSRLFGGVVGHDEAPSLSHHASTAQFRPPPTKRGGSGTVSTATATVNVEFGGGAVRQAQAAETSTTSPSTAAAATRSGTTRVTGSSHVRRDLSSIFAGAASTSRATASTATSSDLWWPTPSSASASSFSQIGAPAGRLASAATAASSYIPFGRLLSSYRPAMSSTTNAVLDSIPHAPSHPPASATNEEGGFEPPPTLLERQLRPRGLSDSSIRSTFLSYANPHHRLVTATGPALSSEPVTIPVVVAPEPSFSADPSSPLSASASPAAAISALRQTLLEDALDPTPGRSVSRRPSAANLRSKSSSAQLRESLNTAVPVLSTSTGTTDSSVTLLDHQQPTVKISEPIGIVGQAATGGGGAAGLIGTVVSSAFGSLAASAGIEAGGRRVGGHAGGDRVAESWKERSRLV
ncbi:hypothetical protein JCM10296v2_001398 [Rhodotorula toruloides]